MTWHPVWNFSGSNSWQQFTIDLAAEAATHGITLGSDFKIKFQQYDNLTISSDGLGYDEIAITTPAAAEDWYQFTLDADQTSTLALSASAAGAMLQLYDAGGNLLATGTGATNLEAVINNHVATTAGTYYARVAGGNGAEYRLVVTKDADFDTESNDSFATAQPLSDGVLGSLGGSGINTITINRTASGWWDSTGYHGSSNSNYIAGYYSVTNKEWHDFFVFDLSAVGESIVDAQLRLYNPSLVSSDPTEDYSLFDVTTPISTLVASGSGNTSIYNDLGSGVVLASRTLSSADNAKAVAVSLNSAGISYLNSNRGNQTAVGGAITTISGTTSQYAFDTSSSPCELVLTLGDPGDWYSIAVPEAGKPICLTTTTPGDGAGEFVNGLSPHIELYDPSGTLVASGTVGEDGRNESITYNTLSTGNYRVRVSGKGDTKGGYFLDMGRHLTVSLPSEATEGDGSISATLTIPAAMDTDLTVNLTSSDPGRLSVPTSVLIPAGQKSLIVPVSVVDDALLNGPQEIIITATATEYYDSDATILIHDNETATLFVHLPANAREGDGSVSGLLLASAAPTRDIVIELSSSDASEVTVPTTVVLPAGQNFVFFDATIVDDNLIDDTQSACITAHVENWTDGLASVNVTDNDRTLAIVLPADGWEGEGTRTAVGTVQLGGIAIADTIVSLHSDDPSELHLPATVTIPAGQDSAAFDVTIVDDLDHDGAQTAMAFGLADGFNIAADSIMVHDNELVQYVWDPVAGPKTASVAFSATARAWNIDGETILTYDGTAQLTATADGPVDVTPTSCCLRVRRLDGQRGRACR